MKKLLPTLLLSLVPISLFALSLKFPNQLAAQEEGTAGINIDPTNPGGRPSASDLLTSGTTWVRFVYKPNSGFNYDSYVNELHQAGIKVNLVLNQETLWPSEGITPTYVDNFANLAGGTAQQFGDRVAAYEIWNEQDVAGLPTSIYIPPELYAPLLTASYNSIKSGNPSVWVVTGGALSGNPDYLRRVIDAAGGLPADGIGVHPYTPNIEEVRQTILRFLSVSQGKPLWITEFGWEVANQQRQADYLKNVYGVVAQFGDQVATAMWYAWSDLMNPGFGLIDASGNPKLAFQYFQQFAALLESILPFFEFLPFPIPPVPPPPTCQVDVGGDRDSRPIPCDPCNQTILYCPSCATSFTVHDTATFYWWEGKRCPPDKDEYWVYPEWGGMVRIDPTQTTIPFVGKKENEDEELYLADYFEGTNEYYQNYSMYWLDWIDHAGVLRKLTPMEYQNQLKKQMVQRAQTTKAWGGRLHEGGIHDYELNYVGRLCWDMPFWVDFLKALAERLGLDIPEITHFCAFEDWQNHPEQFALVQLYKLGHIVFPDIPIVHEKYAQGMVDNLSSLDDHFPPEPDEENYIEKWNAWKESDGGKWYKLWVVAPMVSRDDTPGQILPYLGYRPKDEPKYIPPQVEKVPHVARLYEASQEVNNMLLPYQEFARFAEKETEPIIASAEEEVLGEKTLLAQADFPSPEPPAPGGCGLAGARPVATCEQPAITDTNPNDDLCCEKIDIPLSAVDSFNITEWYKKCEANPNLPGCGSRSRDVSRQFGINLLHPYLTDIWNQTGKAETSGLFNIFRPASIPQFQEVDAADEIEYSYHGGVTPETGKFYFNYLGGVQLAKEWLIRTLTPYVE